MFVLIAETMDIYLWVRRRKAILQHPLSVVHWVHRRHLVMITRPPITSSCSPKMVRFDDKWPLFVLTNQFCNVD